MSILDLQDADAALTAIREADLIWFSGGNQNRLMSFLSQNGLIEAIRARYEHGATVGGTSAGAAVMSRIMLTGIPVDVSAGACKTADGLGLWDGVIVDQHYFRRLRFSRLLDAVLGHHDKVGVGIDESTAVIVRTANTSRSWAPATSW